MILQSIKTLEWLKFIRIKINPDITIFKNLFYFHPNKSLFFLLTSCSPAIKHGTLMYHQPLTLNCNTPPQLLPTTLLIWTNHPPLTPLTEVSSHSSSAHSPTTPPLVGSPHVLRMERVPEEVKIHILSYLPLPDLCQVALLSTYWHFLALDHVSYSSALFLPSFP